MGFGGGLLAAGFALRRGFGELGEAQRMAAQTRAVLKSTGGVANVTAKHVDKLATRISRLSGMDDEAVASGANMLLTFTNIRNEVGKGNNIFDKATEAVADLAAFTGRDMADAAIMVGKALNDTELNAKGTITGWSALRRVGVKITQDMMDQAAAFIKAGKPMEAQKLLLQELNTEFGGQAAAFGTTMPGALGKLNNALDEVLAAFASGFLPLIQKVASVLTKKLADPAFVNRVRELGEIIGTGLFNALRSIGMWFDAHWSDIQGGFRTFMTILRQTRKLAMDTKDVLVTITTPLRIQLKILMAIWDKVLGAVSFGAGLMSHLPFVGDKFAGIQKTVDAARGAMQDPTGSKARKRARKQGNLSGNFDDRRARGGPVRAGMTYLVGERGPELLTMGGSGFVTPGGGGRGGDVVINLDGREIARVALGHIQRSGKRSASQQRGRLGGQNLALS